MRKLQAKTLMEILPENISKVVHQKLVAANCVAATRSCVTQVVFQFGDSRTSPTGLSPVWLKV